MCTLITIPISHYCEKARWSLDRTGVAYEEQAHLQLIHRLYARRAGGGNTVPVLVCRDRVLSESAAIVEWASDQATPKRRLYPADPQATAEIHALERDFDERLGPAGRLWMYHGIRGRRDLALEFGCAGVPAHERRMLALAYPLLIRGIDRLLKVNPETAEAAEAEVSATFDSVAERLADGRPYLCGGEFTAADLTFASLAASVLMPPEYGVTLPQPDDLPPAMGAEVAKLRRHPAGAHALAMFRDERR